MKTAILLSISSKTSNLTTMCIKNSNLKPKRVQAKADKFLRNENVMKWLNNESDNLKTKMEKKKLMLNEMKTRLQSKLGF